MVPIAAPNDLERSHHYSGALGPPFPKGGVAIFDRAGMAGYWWSGWRAASEVSGDALREIGEWSYTGAASGPGTEVLV